MGLSRSLDVYEGSRNLRVQNAVGKINLIAVFGG